MATHTAVGRADGTVVVPVDEARPGETVVIRIDRVAVKQNEEMTVSPTTDPLIDRWREIGRHNRAQLSEDQIARLNGDWLYDENGLPK